MNGDNAIDVYDIVALRNFIDNIPQRGGTFTARLYAANTTIKAGGTRKMNVTLSAAQTATAFQTDIKFGSLLSTQPESVLSGAIISESHIVKTSQTKDGIRVLAYSPTQEPLISRTGVAFSFVLDADSTFSTSSDFILSNIRVAAADGSHAQINDASYTATFAKTYVNSIVFPENDVTIIQGNQVKLMPTVLPVLATNKELMTLIKSISGIRGTIGGRAGDTLNPLDIVKFTSAYATLIRRTTTVESNKIVVGRDARISGPMVKNVVCGTLMGMGFDVVNIGLATTPTTEIAVTMEGACGGIIITASHNPRMWNALKLLNEKGEFLNAQEGNEVLRIAEAEDFEYADVDHLGSYREDNTYDQKHIDLVLGLDLVDVEAIKKANFRVAFDSVNSVGGVILPKLLEQLGVKTVTGLFTEPTGDFQHNPEPLEKNLADIKALMQKGGHDIAFVVDPDVDRLALFCEDGTMYGEEYTLVTVADYILQHTPGNTVSNLSSTRALRDVTRKYGCEYNAAAVGEVNVVTKMKETNAVIGGEGNGGVIYPAAHYGRDALVGIALILTYLAKKGMKTSELRATYPPYFIAKNRIDLTPDTDVDAILAKVKELYKNEEVNDIDGVKIDFPDKWVHLRKSNTEPIIRVYSEASTMEAADELGKKIMDVVYSMV